MPLYTFENKKTGKRKDVFFNMNDKKEYAGPKGDQPGMWERVFMTPSISTDVVDKIDPYSATDFVQRTAKKGMTIGDMADLSKELSERRVDKEGKDVVRDKTEAEYVANRKGLKGNNPFASRRKAQEELGKMGISVDFSKKKKKK